MHLIPPSRASLWALGALDVPKRNARYALFVVCPYQAECHEMAP